MPGWRTNSLTSICIPGFTCCSVELRLTLSDRWLAGKLWQEMLRIVRARWSRKKREKKDIFSDILFDERISPLRTVWHIIEFTEQSMFVGVDVIFFEFFVHPRVDIIRRGFILVSTARHLKQPKQTRRWVVRQIAIVEKTLTKHRLARSVPHSHWQFLFYPRWRHRPTHRTALYVTVVSSGLSCCQ